MNLTLSVHSVDLNLPHKRAAATVTAVPSSSLVNQSYGVSVQNILFGALTILLAVASLLLTYLQLLHMRKQTGSRRSDVEMLEPSKSLPYRNKYPISSWLIIRWTTRAWHERVLGHHCCWRRRTFAWRAWFQFFGCSQIQQWCRGGWSWG